MKVLVPHSQLVVLQVRNFYNTEFRARARAKKMNPCLRAVFVTVMFSLIQEAYLTCDVLFSLSSLSIDMAMPYFT